MILPPSGDSINFLSFLIPLASAGGFFIVIIMVGDKLAIFHPMQKKSKGQKWITLAISICVIPYLFLRYFTFFENMNTHLPSYVILNVIINVVNIFSKKYF